MYFVACENQSRDIFISDKVQYLPAIKIAIQVLFSQIHHTDRRICGAEESKYRSHEYKYPLEQLKRDIDLAPPEGPRIPKNCGRNGPRARHVPRFY